LHKRREEVRTMKPKSIFSLLKDTFTEWREDKASRLGAALAYYAIFAVGPLLVVAIAVAGFVFGEDAAEGQIVNSIQGVVGEDGAQVIEGMVESASSPGAGIIASVIGIAMLLLAASGIFGQLQDALNTVWDAEPKEGGGIIGMLKSRLPHFLMLGLVGLLLLASLIVNAALSIIAGNFAELLPGGAIIWQIIAFAISMGILTLLFAVIYKTLPATDIAWKDVWVGAAITALLFTLGQIALSFYLGFSDVGSAYGAAGSLVLVLVWIYYSAQIFFFGAEFTQVYARNRGSRAHAAEKEAALAARHSPWFGLQSETGG
jgi:membrane protein